MNKIEGPHISQGLNSQSNWLVKVILNAQTKTNQHKPAQTDTNQHKPIHSNTNHEFFTLLDQYDYWYGSGLGKS